MKKLIIFLFTTLLFVSLLSAQNDNCSINIISTDPDNPTNLDCPGKENTFDWRTEYFEVPSSFVPDGNMISPYWQTSNVLLDFLTNNDSPNFHDYLPEDGWELLDYNLDYDPVNQPFIYVAMYNKYESFIRFFRTFSFQNQNNFVTLNLSLQNDLTALLHPSTGFSQAMDQFSIREVYQSSRFANDDYQYVYFDIPVEYDPCTCIEADGSNLRFNAGRMNTQTLDLYGRYIETSQSLGSIINVGVGTSDRYPEEFLAGVDADAQIAGVSTFNRWSELLEHHRRLKDEIEPYKRKYAQLQLVDKVLALAIKAGGGDVLKAMKLIKVIDEPAPPPGQPDNDTYLNGKNIFDGLVGGLNLFGTGIKKKIDALDGQLSSLGSTTLSHGELVMQGTMESQFNDVQFTVDLPGRVDADCLSDDYPVYNEVLGRMAVLRTPIVTQNNYISTLIDQPLDLVSELIFDPSSLDYVFNPSANINEDATTIWAALRVFPEPVPTLLGDATPYISVNMTDINEDGSIFMTPLVPLECLGQYTSQVFSRSNVNLVSPTLTNTQLVLVVEYAFNDGNQAIQQYTYPVNINQNPVILTNDIGAVTANATPNYQHVLNIPATDYRETETIFAFSEIYIQGDQRLANFTIQPEVILIDGTVIPEEITSNGDIFVEFVASQIVVESGSDLISSPPTGSGGEILLRIGDFPELCSPLTSTDDDIAAFCGSDDYKAKTSQSRQDTEETSTVPLPTASELKGNDEPPLGISVSPNPVGDYASILLELPTDEMVTISIIDIAGRTVEVLIQGQSLLAGKHYFDLPGQRLSPGNYVLRVQTRQGTTVCRFVR